MSRPIADWFKMRFTGLRDATLVAAARGAPRDVDAAEEGKLPRLRSYRLAELTSPEVADAITRGIDSVVLPVGSTEQHGAHLPLSTDSLHTVAVLERVAESLPALIAPLIPVGRADHHMAFPGTISVKHETLHATIRDWCDSFFQHGFRHVLIYSGHGGNAVPLARIIDDLMREDASRSIIGCTDWNVYDGALFPAAEALGIGKFEAGWHAGELETSMILALDERLVMMDRARPGFIGDLTPFRDKLMREGVRAIAPSGVLGDPRPATRDHGERYLDALTESVTRFFRAAIEEREAGAVKAGRGAA
jgi:creatinine amidohydrolase/Fe(II)-dependent formamide hydrolase-like protein